MTGQIKKAASGMHWIVLGTGPSISMMLVTNMEGNNSNNIDDAYNRPSRFLTPGLLVEVETETCHVRPNEESGFGNALDYSGDGTFNIKYVLDGRVERNVHYGRVKSLNPLSVSSHRTSSNQLQHLSILYPLHQPQTQDSTSPSFLSPALASTNSIASSSPAGPHGIAKVLISSMSWRKYDKNANPFLKYLRDRQK